MPRWLDVFYWPIITIFVWGFITQYLRGIQPQTGNFLGSMLLGAIIFWMIFQRAQQDLSIAFLQDIWSRSIINLYVSPLTNLEFIVASIAVGLIIIIITLAVMAGLAFVLYVFYIFALGFAIIPFIAMLLMFAWSLGLFSTGIIFRFGTDAQIIAFSISFVLQPFVAVFYPLKILPGFVQHIALAIPITYVFEGMRELLATGMFNSGLFFSSLILNVIYMILCGIFFGKMFDHVKKKGLLAKLE